ncbi:hypothetical protein B0H15DRAFT_957998 [Mycena belliarum]|uniref:F-box domain-containing protein n=1 Tax=Mycena belliarum TaxID=1033014 RepID=A0AAD6TNB4_9AGAR|nr:hypothetical protein B0H15DRAFT_957998 [Mycena belliae]
MATFQKYILDAYVAYLDACSSPLFHSRPGLTYEWEVHGAEAAHAVTMRIDPASDLPSSPVAFTVFGVVGDTGTDGTVLLQRPAWHNEGSSGSVLTVRYEQQILSLILALESRKLPFIFENGNITLTTTAMWDFLRAAPYALGARARYRWFLVDGRSCALKVDGDHEVAPVVVFGLVKKSWVTDGVIGRELGLEFDKQLLELCRILQDRGVCTWNEEVIVLRTESDYTVTEGAAIVASVVLSVASDGEHPYDLAVDAFEAVFVDRAVRRLQEYLGACRDAEDVRRLLRAVDAYTVLRVFLLDPSSAQKILEYARSSTLFYLHWSDTGWIKKFPPECLAQVLAELNIRDRISFGRTCRDHKIAVSALVFHEQSVAFAASGLNFAEVRLLLLATHTLVGGSIILQIMRAIPRSRRNQPDFYIDRRDEYRVLRFLELAGGFSPVSAPTVLGQYSITTLKSSTAVIRVFGCPNDPILGILLNHASHQFGFCDANTVYHAYPQLLDEGVALTTPAIFHIGDQLEDHIATWTLLHDATQLGLRWWFDNNKQHICGSQGTYNCPATLRITTDGGWSRFSSIPCALGAAAAVARVTWSFGGTGCRAGILDGGRVYPVSTEANEECVQSPNLCLNPNHSKMSDFLDVDVACDDAPPPYVAFEYDDDDATVVGTEAAASTENDAAMLVGTDEGGPGEECTGDGDHGASGQTVSRASSDDDRSVTAVYDFDGGDSDQVSRASTHDNRGVYEFEVHGGDVVYPFGNIYNSRALSAAADDFDARTLYTAADDMRGGRRGPAVYHAAAQDRAVYLEAHEPAGRFALRVRRVLRSVGRGLRRIFPN